MNEEDRLDLSALDPLREPERWRGVVESTRARIDAVMEERERRRGPLLLIAGWTRPLLAAAAIAVALLIPLELALEAREAHAERVERLVSLSTEWTPGDAPPSAAEFVRVLGEREAR